MPQECVKNVGKVDSLMKTTSLNIWQIIQGAPSILELKSTQKQGRKLGVLQGSVISSNKDDRQNVTVFLLRIAQKILGILYCTVMSKNVTMLRCYGILDLRTGTCLATIFKIPVTL